MPVQKKGARSMQNVLPRYVHYNLPCQVAQMVMVVLRCPDEQGAHLALPRQVLTRLTCYRLGSARFRHRVKRHLMVGRRPEGKMGCPCAGMNQGQGDCTKLLLPHLFTFKVRNRRRSPPSKPSTATRRQPSLLRCTWLLHRWVFHRQKGPKVQPERR
ncbi:hypothetical protein N656DRAFT_18314 [Canariomyces notabilis]|uniref:Uncharacterized protein n=1 Tax=Canariomyces notabilis TaxID=2074819 RepID=A0AAN6YWZ9_9PEZI|nr:hypothetical protein N656DRAFT_18314 [Canariomyces arenarius]